MDAHTFSGVSNEELAMIAKTLAHPARIQIIKFLMDKKQCIGGDIVDEIGLAQSTVSEHLRILKSSGIIIGQITRPKVCYSLNPDRLQDLLRFVDLVCEGNNKDDAECWISTDLPDQNS